MALSEDQKAMLRLLSQRGEQGYEDLAALMGIEVGEVHAKALEAASQLEAEGIPAPTIPPPPASSAAAGPPPPKSPPAPTESEPRPGPVEEPAESPKAEKPAAEAAKPRPAKSAGPPRPRPSLPQGDGARAAIAAGILVVVALVVVLIVGGGGDSGDTPAVGSGEGAAAEETVNANGGGNAGKEVTQAILGPVDGSDAQGIATFGRVKNSLALQVEAEGLEPTAAGESYTIWLYQSPRKMLPLASTRVDKTGKIGVQAEVPTEVLGYLANETFGQIDISRTSDATLKASLAKATSEKKAPVYTGADVLRGPITGPIIGAAR